MVRLAEDLVSVLHMNEPESYANVILFEFFFKESLTHYAEKRELRSR